MAFEHRDITLDVLTTLQEMMDNVEKLLPQLNTDGENIPSTYAIKNISNDGMKLTLSNTLSSYSVKNVSNDGMKLTLSKVGLRI